MRWRGRRKNLAPAGRSELRQRDAEEQRLLVDFDVDRLVRRKQLDSRLLYVSPAVDDNASLAHEEYLDLRPRAGVVRCPVVDLDEADFGIAFREDTQRLRENAGRTRVDPGVRLRVHHHDVVVAGWREDELLAGGFFEASGRAVHVMFSPLLVGPREDAVLELALGLQ